MLVIDSFPQSVKHVSSFPKALPLNLGIKLSVQRPKASGEK